MHDHARRAEAGLDDDYELHARVLPDPAEDEGGVLDAYAPIKGRKVRSLNDSQCGTPTNDEDRIQCTRSKQEKRRGFVNMTQ